VSHEPGYATPIALRSAITDHLRILAAERPGRSLQDLLRQFAYDRLLYRVFSGPDSDRWVLKGATALLARLGGDARHTVDVDLYDRSGNLDEAELALRSALSAHPEYRHRIRKRRWAENGA
jgi:predicted nucleotidyltransferase component of viral defense system